MAGGKGKIHLHPKAGTNGLDKRPEDINKKGRRPSIKKELEQIAQLDGVMRIEAENIEIQKDGSAIIKLPKLNALALKLWEWAMSNKGGDSIKAIEMIMNTFDGKPESSTQVNIQNNIDNEKDDRYDLRLLTSEERKRLEKLLLKAIPKEI